MKPLYIKLHPLDQDRIELRYWQDRIQYESQVLALSDIQNLIQTSETDYYNQVSNSLIPVGQQLFHWLDGSGRWLSRAIQDCPAEGLILAIDTSAGLAHLPWEVLHDGSRFLVDATAPMVVPIRWVEGSLGDVTPRDQGLHVVFMATAPESVEPVLDFEQEESEILRITEELPLQLRVEESGCLEELGKLWRRFPEGSFDVFHLNGHSDIEAGIPYFITESLTGERVDAQAHDLIAVFAGRLPRLVFLSGCRTGESGNAGSVPSLAEAVVRAGVSAALGWGRPVGDEMATRSAQHLYERLSEGFDIARAVGSTYQFLRK